MGRSSVEDDGLGIELDQLHELQRAYLERDAAELLATHFPDAGQQIELVRLGQELLKKYKNLYEKACARNLQSSWRAWVAQGHRESRLVGLLLGGGPGAAPPSLPSGGGGGAGAAAAVLEARSLLGRVDARLRRARLDFAAVFRCADEEYSKSVSLGAFARQLCKLRALQEHEVGAFQQLLIPVREKHHHDDSMEVPYDLARLLAVAARPLLLPAEGGPEEQRAALAALQSVRDALKKSRPELSSWDQVLRQAGREDAAAGGAGSAPAGGAVGPDAPGGAGPAVCSAVTAWLLQELPGLPPVVAHAAVLRAAGPCVREGEVVLNEETVFKPPLPGPPVFVHLSSAGLRAQLAEALDGGLTLRLQAATAAGAGEVRLRCHPSCEAPRYEAGPLEAHGASAEGGAGAGGLAVGLTVEVEGAGARAGWLEKEVHFVPRLSQAPAFVWAETCARDLRGGGAAAAGGAREAAGPGVDAVCQVRAGGFRARGPTGARRYAYQAFAEHVVTAQALAELAPL